MTYYMLRATDEFADGWIIADQEARLSHRYDPMTAGWTVQGTRNPFKATQWQQHEKAKSFAALFPGQVQPEVFEVELQIVKVHK